MIDTWKINDKKKTTKTKQKSNKKINEVCFVLDKDSWVWYLQLLYQWLSFEENYYSLSGEFFFFLVWTLLVFYTLLQSLLSLYVYHPNSIWKIMFPWSYLFCLLWVFCPLFSIAPWDLRLRGVWWRHPIYIWVLQISHCHCPILCMFC